MTKNIYKRNIQELEQKASMFWPEELSKKEAELSVIPKLIETQAEFISILSVKANGIENYFEIIDAASMSANLFLKHLVVLSDFGGEMLQRINREFNNLFENGILQFVWKEKILNFRFKMLPVKGVLSNDRLGISGKKILIPQKLTGLHKDIISLLLFGATSINDNTASILRKCEIASYLGNPQELNTFIKQRYIYVSRITRGAASNNLGHIAQQYVYDYIKNNLSISDFKIRMDGTIPNVSHTLDLNKLTTFDVVVSKGRKYVAIEVGFQVTTNSVIERKAGQAQNRMEKIKKFGHKIAYVIDGAGNFQRKSAVSTICDYSDCTVAFSMEELKILIGFIKKNIER